MIRFEGVTKIYSTEIVLKNINWEIKKGEKVGLVGSNGAGKSTQFKILIGEEDQTSGTILKEGNPKKALDKICDIGNELNISVTKEEVIEYLSTIDDEATKMWLIKARGGL